MRIQIVNPNTSEAMTAKMAAAARTAAGAGTEVWCVTSASGPASIESACDEALAVPGLLAQISAGVRAGVDAHVIACFGDPGLAAARELARAPVLGIAQAAMHAASLLGGSFSVVTTLASTLPTAEHLVQRYGMQAACRRLRATGIPVLALEEASPATRARLLAECRAALAEDGANAIVLGCAGMADLCGWLAQELDVPVIDGVVAAVKLCEALASAGWRAPRPGGHPVPARKPCTGPIATLAEQLTFAE